MGGVERDAYLRVEVGGVERDAYLRSWWWKWEVWVYILGGGGVGCDVHLRGWQAQCTLSHSCWSG